MRVAKQKEPMVWLRATVRQIYGDKALRPGDRFPEQVPQRIADQLIRMHFAEDEANDIDVVRPKRAYRRRDMKAEP